MLSAINTKVLISGAVVLTAAALVLGATFAFFSDTETSTGNVLAAGAIDLKIDNESFVTNNDGVLVASPDTSWDLRDLTIEKFFNFSDLKPGDLGEDTISLHVNDNDAWACAAARVTENADTTCTEPESADDPACGLGNPLTNGDLDQQVNFAFWKDDGDNVLEDDETIVLQGPISDLNNEGKFALADSTGNGVLSSTAIPGGSTQYIGKAWCFGTLTPNPAPQGSNQNPVERGTTGFLCNGSSVNNAAQTDKVSADIQFYAVQSRNNSQFTCDANFTPNWESTVEVNSDDLATSFQDVQSDPTKWFMYNDDNDQIDNTLGSFVAGPSTPPNGTGSVQFTLAANPNSRKNIATYQFSGMTLASIAQMSYGAYSHSGVSGPDESPYLNFNVDFNGSDTWQRRLVYVPSANAVSVPQDAWNIFDVIDGGNAKWTWSGYADNSNKWPDSNTNQYRTWNDIVTSFPGVRVRVTDSWLGVRVGEPGPSGYIGNVDFFKLNGTTYDFDN